MRRALQKLGKFSRDHRAMAAIEFAVVMPVLITIMLGGIQLVTYTNATRRVDQTVRSVSEMISQAVPPGNSTTATVNALDLHFAYDLAMVTFPYVLTDAQAKGNAWWQNIVINFASVKFTTISSGCSGSADQSPCTLASVVWTSTGVYSGTNRPCIVPQLPADDTSAPSSATLPRSMFGSPSIIVVDIVYTFRPTFGAGIVPAIKIARTAYIQPRYATLINFDTTNNDGIASKCPGF